MKRQYKIATFILAGLLQVAPLATRIAETSPGFVKSPIAIVMTWALRVAMLAGAYHTVSAATAALTSASTVNGTQGTRLSYAIKISDGQNRVPGSWIIGGVTYNANRTPNTITNGMPPGLSLTLATGIIGGIPTKGGTFLTPITACENANAGGAHLSFTLTFKIAALTQPTVVTNQPASQGLHIGEPLNLVVGASGTAPFSYKWQKDNVDIPGATTNTYSVPVIDAATAGSYVAFVTGAGGTTNSNPAVITVTPLQMTMQSHTPDSTAIQITTAPGRHYILQAISSLGSGGWLTAAETNATGSVTTVIDPTPEATERYWRYYPSP